MMNSGRPILPLPRRRVNPDGPISAPVPATPSPSVSLQHIEPLQRGDLPLFGGSRYMTSTGVNTIPTGSITTGACTTNHGLPPAGPSNNGQENTPPMPASPVSDSDDEECTGCREWLDNVNNKKKRKIPTNAVMGHHAGLSASSSSASSTSILLSKMKTKKRERRRSLTVRDTNLVQNLPLSPLNSVARKNHPALAGIDQIFASPPSHGPSEVTPQKPQLHLQPRTLGATCVGEGGGVGLGVEDSRFEFECESPVAWNLPTSYPQASPPTLPPSSSSSQLQSNATRPCQTNNTNMGARSIPIPIPNLETNGAGISGMQGMGMGMGTGDPGYLPKSVGCQTSPSLQTMVPIHPLPNRRPPKRSIRKPYLPPSSSVPLSSRKKKDTNRTDGGNGNGNGDFWICQFCEYEAIFGYAPLALISTYNHRVRAERRARIQRKRLLEKARMKGKNARKGNGARRVSKSVGSKDVGVGGPGPGAGGGVGPGVKVGVGVGVGSGGVGGNGISGDVAEIGGGQAHDHVHAHGHGHNDGVGGMVDKAVGVQTEGEGRGSRCTCHCSEN